MSNVRFFAETMLLQVEVLNTEDSGPAIGWTQAARKVLTRTMRWHAHYKTSIFTKEDSSHFLFKATITFCG